MNDSNDYLIKCGTCTGTTSKAYARAHEGKCKPCVTGAETKTVPCTYCDTPTASTGTKMCDGCWEVESRLPGFLIHPKAREYVRRTLEGAEAYVRAGGGPYVTKEEHP